MIEFVEVFHRKFGFKTLDQPGFLPPDHMKVRLNFILEELIETAIACGFELVIEQGDDGQGGDLAFVPLPIGEMMATRNLHEAFDGLLDTVYVVLGTANLMGFSEPANNTDPHWSIWNEGFARVQQANMAKVRVDRVEQSKRGTLFDACKPEGWQPPCFDDLFEE
jgi:predicted HAD superfamily Cof-like phosphohydrolase